MTAAATRPPDSATLRATRFNRPATPAIEIVLPVYNEERALAHSVRTLHAFLSREIPASFQITIADNASTDRTLALAIELAHELRGVEVLRLERKGRGYALSTAWRASAAEVVGYMDVDLSTDLSCLGDLLLPLLANEGDIAIGSRLAPGARVRRGLKRELISRSYNMLVRAMLHVGFSDAQCGFKAARRDVLAPLLPLVRDGAWFFDTELLYIAQRHKIAIREVPVRWVDDPDSRVDILRTALEDLRGIRRLRREARAGDGSPRAHGAGSRALPAQLHAR